VITEGAELHVGGLPIGPVHTSAKSSLGRRHELCWVACHNACLDKTPTETLALDQAV